MTNDQQTNRPLHGVVFDLDGTLLTCPYDFKEMRRLVMEIAAEAGLPIKQLTKLGILEAITAGERLLGGEVGRQFRHCADQAVLSVELAGMESSSPIPGAQETLRWLRAQGVRTAIITRNSSIIVDTLLRRVEFQYDALLPREAVVNVKPHPEHLQVALAHLRCQPSEVLMVGDHVWDITCGKAASVDAVGVVTGASDRQKLLDAGAIAVLSSVADLPAWVLDRYRLAAE
jgi:phosphoglycolate phosphatase